MGLEDGQAEGVEAEDEELPVVELKAVPLNSRKGKVPLQERAKIHVLLASYEMLMLEQSALKGLQWEVLVVDEGHRLKNKDSRLFQLLKIFK